MYGRSGTMSPVSTDGSEWSGINGYNASSIGAKSEPPFSPPIPQGRSNLSTPPTSTGPPSDRDALSMNGPQSPLKPPGNGNPSPPSSVTAKSARSSDGTLSDQQSRKYRRMEDSLGQHYHVLRRYLQTSGRDDITGLRPNKARDKLLRLSPTQFHELSTDVYDELLRRQAAAGPPPGRPGPPPQNVPPFLPPRQGFHEKRNQARQKLSSLQQQRFRDLATDVFCELERRFPHFRGPPRGPPNGYGPPNGFPGGPRSASRGPPPGPGGRGYPPGGPMRFPPRQGSLGGSINGDVGENGPLPKSFQSNTIVPNKSTMVEEEEDGLDDDDDDGRSDAFALDGMLASRRGTTMTLGENDRKLLTETQSQVANLQDKVEALEEQLKSKTEEITRLENSERETSTNETERQEWEDLRADLESKVSDAQSLNSSLQYELDRARSDRAEMEQALQASQENSGDGEWRSRYDDLEQQYQSLQSDLREQQQVTEEVKREAATFLQEMKVMTENSGSSWEQEERLAREVHRLEEDVKEWKGRYAKAKTQLRHLRASSYGLPGGQPDVDAFAKQNDLTQENGAVKDVHITKFQISIDELLRTARSGEPSQALDRVKAVVLAVRHISEEVEPLARNDPTVRKAKSRVSATANNVITAAKNFASSNGLSPVSLLDAAASHLTTSVIELVRIVKIRPTPTDELEDEDFDGLAPMQSPSYFSVPPSQGRHSRNESVYSAISSPPSTVRSKSRGHSRVYSRSNLMNGISAKLNYGVQRRDSQLEELKIYLEDQTEGLVQSIQALVACIRAEDDIEAIQSNILSISSVVSRVISATDTGMSQPTANPKLRERAGPIVAKLAQCLDRLTQTGADGENVQNSGQLRQVTTKLPPIAFEIARETKELVQRIDQLDYEGGEEDDFR